MTINGIPSMSFILQRMTMSKVTISELSRNVFPLNMLDGDVYGKDVVVDDNSMIERERIGKKMKKIVNDDGKEGDKRADMESLEWGD